MSIKLSKNTILNNKNIAFKFQKNNNIIDLYTLRYMRLVDILEIMF